MDSFTLRQVADATGGEWSGDGETKLSNIVIDNRLVQPGDLFVAIKGDRFDGHDFIPSAFAAGASAVVSERPVENGAAVVVEDTRRALLDLARFNRQRFDGLVVGVTGSVGKTTTKEMIAAVLSAACPVLKTEGNLNNAIGLSKTLFRLDSSVQAAVIEMGMSARGEISALSETARPDVGVITNIGVCHIEYLGSRENILKAKLEILDGMPEGAPLIVGGDNDLLSNLVVPDHPVLFCGIEKENADYRAENIRAQGLHTLFDVCIARTGQRVPVDLPALGRHNVYNALFGFAVGILAQMQPETIAKALQKYEPAGMRQKTVQKDGVTIIADCYNASPDSMRASMATLCQLPASGRKIAVLGDMLELGKLSAQAHREVGEMAAELGVDLLYCTGPESEKMLEGAGSKLPARHFADKHQLAEALKEEIRPGDVVVFKASRGMQLESVIQTLFGDI